MSLVILYRQLDHYGFCQLFFWSKVFYTFIKEHSRHCFIICFFISAISFIIGRYISNVPFGILYGFSCIIFYSMGDYWRKYGYLINKMFVVLGVVAWIFCIIKGRIELASFICNYYPLSVFSSFVATYIIYVILSKSNRIIRNSYITFISRNTLLILCYHTITLYSMRIIRFYYTSFSIDLFLELFLYLFLGFFLTKIHVFITNK